MHYVRGYRCAPLTGRSHGVTGAIAALLAVCLVPAVALATPPRKTGSITEQQVQQALRMKLDGMTGGDALLRQTLARSPDDPAANWHTGHVQIDNRWLHVDEVSARNAGSHQQTVYRRQRDQVLNDESLSPGKRQRKMAMYCTERSLVEQRRAHLTKVLEFDPENIEIREKLGHVNVDGSWLEPDEIRQAAERAESAVAAMATWRPQLEEIRDVLAVDAGLSFRRLRKHEEAMRAWNAVNDPDAIPAMELVFASYQTPPGEPAVAPVRALSQGAVPALRKISDRDRAIMKRMAPPGAVLVVEKLGTIASHQAAVSLARHAVFAGSGHIRALAVEKLKSRTFDQYVPVLLAALHTEPQVRANLFQRPDGRLFYRQTFYREGQEHAELAVLDTEYRYVSVPGGSRQRAFQEALNMVPSGGQGRESIEQQTAASRITNLRIREVLVETTGQGAAEREEPAWSAEQWWQWWNEYNEVFVEGQKPTRQSYRTETVSLEGTRPLPMDRLPFNTFPSESSSRSASSRRGLDCLATGTPIWTDRGPVAVEEIVEGDMVLAQHADTGELAYKPVLRTTERPAAPVVRVTVAGQTIEASGGHRFWVAGEGWVHARRMKAGSRLYGVGETCEVEAVGPGAALPTYNLIVADFHTYFVGPGRVMSHDNTIVSPTDAVLPGLRQR